jgi:uroporphyrinogen-III synthase
VSDDPTPLPIVVTRPATDAAALVARLAASGREVLAMPLLAIEPVADARPLADAMARLADYRLAIFVSPNAVRAALGQRTGEWPATTSIGVMGPGSAQALKSGGIAPSIRVFVARGDDGRFDSEGLLGVLDREFFVERDPRAVLLVRGNGGRPWLAERLRERGLRVDEVEGYRRVRPSPDPDAAARLRAWHAAGRSVAFVVTSSEALAHLEASIDEVLHDVNAGARRRWLHASPVYAPHPRIVEAARERGFHDVRQTRGGDDGIVAAIT